MTAPELHDSDLSPIRSRVAAYSRRGQKLTKRSVKFELWSLFIASAAGVTSWRLGAAQLDVLAAIAGVAFIVSLVALGWRAWRKPEEAWYSGRAGAESLRTLGWRFALGGNPFPETDSVAKATKKYVRRSRKVVLQLGQVRLPNAGTVTAGEVTPAMLAARARPLAERRAIYKQNRILGQQKWYTEKSARHAKAARFWLSVSGLASTVGVAAAVIKFVGLVDIDGLGVAAAVASSAIAWNQLNQNRNQAIAYDVTAGELSLIASEVELIVADDWAQFVSDSEDAISREHTMWLARHGQQAISFDDDDA
jgi:hypothetical protein